MKRRIVVLAAVLAPAAFSADLPVREVILYKHGVGFFERSGDLKPGETARLTNTASASLSAPAI